MQLGRGTAMPEIEFSFPGSDSAKASQLAKELRRGLIDAGVPAFAISMQRADPTHMNTADLVQILIGVAGLMLQGTSFALDIREMIKREKCSVRIKTEKGAIELGPGEVDLEQLRVIINEAFNAKGPA